MKIIYVDGFQIRNVFGDIDFNLMHGRGVSWYTPWFIPPGEVWVEKRAKTETSFLLKVDRLERIYYRRIGNYWQARKRVAKLLCKPTNKNFILRTYKYKNAGLTVRIVNGEIVRRSIDQSFVAGGHNLVYSWYIPKNEIWLDSTVEPAERKYILSHEITEYHLMKKGMHYNNAHNIAGIAEKKARARDGIAHYPIKNLIEPLPYLRSGNGKKRILIIGGIHGDEPLGTYAIAKFLLEGKKIPEVRLDFIPLVNPAGFALGTRQNKEGVDINRCFFDKPKYSEPREVTLLRKFAKRANPYDLMISLHEDLERKEFYLYDIGNGQESKTVKNIFGIVKKFNVPLYSGVDDIELKNFAIEGYIPADPQSQFPGLEEYFSRSEKIRRGLIIEIPGKLSLPEKIELATKIIRRALELF